MFEVVVKSKIATRLHSVWSQRRPVYEPVWDSRWCTYKAVRSSLRTPTAACSRQGNVFVTEYIVLMEVYSETKSCCHYDLPSQNKLTMRLSCSLLCYSFLSDRKLNSKLLSQSWSKAFPLKTVGQALRSSSSGLHVHPYQLTDYRRSAWPPAGSQRFLQSIVFSPVARCGISGKSDMLHHGD